MDYHDLRFVHMVLAVFSITGFVLRWSWMMYESTLSVHGLTRVLPHIIDTLFLASAVWLSVTIRQYPFTDAWLTAKIFGLVGYIVLGSFALKRAATVQGQIMAFCGALLVFAWIVSVARMKTVWGYLSFLN